MYVYVLGGRNQTLPNRVPSLPFFSIQLRAEPTADTQQTQARQAVCTRMAACFFLCSVLPCPLGWETAGKPWLSNTRDLCPFSNILTVVERAWEAEDMSGSMGEYRTVWREPGQGPRLPGERFALRLMNPAVAKMATLPCVSVADCSLSLS